MKETKLKFYLQLSWVSKTLIWFSTFLNISPLLSSVLIFSIMPGIPLLIIMFLTSYNQIIFQMLIGIIPFRITLPALFAYCWILVGPALIYKYETQLLPSFLWKVKPLISRKEYFKLNKIASEFSSSTHVWSTVLFFVALFMGWVIFPYAEVNFKVSHMTHPFYVYSVLLMSFSMFVGTFGLYGVVLSIKLVRCFSKCKVFINVSDPSKRGGLGFIAGFAIKTTILFASGFAIIPFLYNLSIWTAGPGQTLGLTLVAIFILFVLLSFIWPISSVYTMAKKRKVVLLQKYLNILTYEFIERVIKKSSKMKPKPIEIQLTTWYIQRLQTIKVMPIEGGIILQLLTTIGVPIIVTIIQYQLT